MMNVQVDGVWHQFPKGTRVIEACSQAGKYVPRYCYHPKLSSPGNCRMCLIEMGMPKMGADRKPELDADGKPVINWIPRPQISCAQDVSEGMGIRTDSPMARECRQGVMEFLLINHPLDCPICDQAGECRLQEFSVEYGNEAVRAFSTKKSTNPSTLISGRASCWTTNAASSARAAFASRKEIAKDDALGFVDRGSYSTLTAHPGAAVRQQLHAEYRRYLPGGGADLQRFSFQDARLVPQGNQEHLHELRDRLQHRDWQSCRKRCLPPDSAREQRRELGVDVRLRSPQFPLPARRSNRITTLRRCGRLDHTLATAEWKQAFSKAAAQLREFKGEEIAIIASGRATNEELYLTRRLANTLKCDLVDIVPRTGEADDILLSADRNPNTSGAKLLGVAQSTPGSQLKAIIDGVNDGKIHALICLGEDAAEHGASSRALENLPCLIAMSILPNATTAAATVVLPSAGFAEKRGSMINLKGRLQRLNRAISSPGDARDDWEILRDLVKELTGSNGLYMLEDLFKAMAADTPALAGLSLSKIGDLGVQIVQGDAAKDTPVAPIERATALQPT